MADRAEISISVTGDQELANSLLEKFMACQPVSLFDRRWLPISHNHVNDIHGHKCTFTLRIYGNG